jgi:hypothetical protein
MKQLRNRHRGFTSLASSFARDCTGVVMIEFAFLAAPTIILVLLSLEWGYQKYLQAAIDYGVQTAARKIMTGYVQAQTVNGAPLTAAQFRTNILCPLLPSLISCNNVFVNIKTFQASSEPTPYYSYVNSSKSGLIPPALNNANNNYCIGKGSSYVILQVAYPVPAFNIMLSQFGATTMVNGVQTYLLMSTASFKNEPFTASSNTTAAGC